MFLHMVSVLVDLSSSCSITRMYKPGTANYQKVVA